MSSRADLKRSLLSFVSFASFPAFFPTLSLDSFSRLSLHSLLFPSLFVSTKTDSTESTRKCENLTMSSFSPKNEGMIDCYQINYTTCHQLGDPKVSAMAATHCSIPSPSSNGGRQRDVKQTSFAPSFAPTGSSFRFVSEPPRSDDRHVYDMPHRRSNHHHSGRVLEVSDDPALDTVAPVLVTLSSSDGMNVFSHHDNHHDGIHLEQHPQFVSQSSRPVSEKDGPVSPSEISVSQSLQEHEQLLCRNQSPTRIEFVHLFQCSS